MFLNNYVFLFIFVVCIFGTIQASDAKVSYPAIIDFNQLEVESGHYKREDVLNDLKNKTIIGLVHKNLNFVYSAILDWANQFKETEIQFILVDENFENYASIEILHGLIFPGADDSYPKEQQSIKLNDLQSPNKDEQLYIKYYQLADYHRIPTFGICAGAQHLTLFRNGMVAPLKTIIRSEWESLLLGLNYLLFDKKFFTSIKPFTWMHFLAMDPNDQNQFLENCNVVPIEDIEVKRMHGFYSMEAFLGDGVELAGASDDMPMSFSYQYWNFATQFHPENHVWIEDQDEPLDWLFESNHKKSVRVTKNMLSNFLNLCKGYRELYS